jgi:hypothetical protein
MQWVLLGAVIVGIAAIEFRLVRDRIRTATIREVVRREQLIARFPISAQWARGWWGRGNAKGMQLLVRERSFELSYPFPGGSLLSTEWFCRATESQMKAGRVTALPPQMKRECIVVSFPSIDHPMARQDVLLSAPPSHRDLARIWDALAKAGVQPIGEPPGGIA